MWHIYQRQFYVSNNLHASLNYVLTKTLFKHRYEEIKMKIYGGIDLHSNNNVSLQKQ